MVKKALAKKRKEIEKHFFLNCVQFGHANLIKYTDARHTTPAPQYTQFFRNKSENNEKPFHMVIIHFIPAPILRGHNLRSFSHFLLLTGIRIFFYVLPDR